MTTVGQDTLELLQWLKLKGIHPETFNPQDKFYLPVKKESKTLMELSEKDLQEGVVWAPDLQRLTKFLLYKVVDLAQVQTLSLEKGLFLTKLRFRGMLVEGAGKTEVNSLIQALQNKEAADVIG